MPPYSVRQVVRAEKRNYNFIRVIAAVLTILALLLLAVIVLAVSEARSSMSTPPRPLANYSSTMMPSFSLASIQSLDEQNNLAGWLFPPEGRSLGTVIMVHHSGDNRLQFDADTLLLYEYFTSKGYGVLSFDLRHSGESAGQFSTYGYGEWEDVLAAMEYAWNRSTSDHLILFGFGSGTAAVLLAMENLPAEGADREAFYGTDQTVKKRRLIDLPFSRKNVGALILDGPASTLDAYIRADLSDSLLDRLLQRHTVPLAVRFSAQTGSTSRLLPILSRTAAPVLLIGEGPESGGNSTRFLIDERQRLHADSTQVYQPEDTGFLEAFPTDPERYIRELDRFMVRFPDRRNPG